MAITKSRERALSLVLATEPAPPRRRAELLWLAGASLLVACGLALVGFAKTGQTRDDGHPLDLNTVSSAQELVPYLARAMDTGASEAAANRIFSYLDAHRPLPNVGALAGIRANGRRLPIPKMKPLFVVRDYKGFLTEYALWCSIYFAAFWIVHFAWRARRFRGRPGYSSRPAPAHRHRSDAGREPARSTARHTRIRKFAWGVALGCALLLLPLLRVFERRWLSATGYTPLFAALTLFALLVVFGSGPTGSDAHVNLGPIQPVELIKILLVFFLAGYFAHKWQWLRELQIRRFRRLNFPRLSQTLPVMIGVAIPLGVFFLLKDLGPALITGMVFLAMFAIARDRAGLALAGLGILIGGVMLGYHFGSRQRWWNAFRSGSHRGITTCAAATSWRTRSGLFRPEAHWDRARASAIRR